MVIYTCPNCNKDFFKKFNFDTHMKKKKSCVNNSKIFLNIPNILQNIPNISNTNSNICDYCGKSFSTVFNLNKHSRYNCKLKKEDDKNKKNIFELLLEKAEKEKKQEKAEKEQLKKEMSELQKQLLDLTKTIKELSNKTTVVNNNYGNINNIVIPNDKLAKFGKEDLTKITQQEFLKIRNQQGIAIFKECAKLIYNNKSFNRTVYVADVSRKKAMIWDGKDWILSDLNEIIDVMKEKIRDFYNINLDTLEDQRILKDFESRIQKYFEMLYDEYDEDKADDKKFMKRVEGLQDKFEKDLIKWLFNIKKEVIDNYNDVLQSICSDKNLIEQKKLIDIAPEIEGEIPKRIRGRPKSIKSILVKI